MRVSAARPATVPSACWTLPWTATPGPAVRAPGTAAARAGAGARAGRLTSRLTYDLDQADRVTAVHGPQWAETYDYDETGNVTDAAWPGALRGQEAAGERRYTGTLLQRAGAVRYTYDPQGRVIRRTAIQLSRTPDVWEYTWDGEDRLTDVLTPDGTRWHYRYDPLGRRAAKERLTVGGDIAERTDFTWDGLTLVEQTTRTGDTTPAISLTWEYDGLRPLSQVERITPLGVQGRPPVGAETERW